MFRLSDEGLALIKACEGFRGTLYDCPADNCTIGYGHLVHHGPTGTMPQLEAPFVNGLTEPEAADLLRRDLMSYEATVYRLVTAPIDQSEYDALVSFEYNTGALARSTLLKKLNACDYEGAADEFDKWVKSNGMMLPGLVARRHLEEGMFRRDLPRVLLT